MAHGGERAGAGRPKGALTKRTREIAERASAEGKSPLEVMLENMRHFQQVALDAERAITEMGAAELPDESAEAQFKFLLAKVKQAAGLRQMAHECARDAAAYMHPKLASVAHTGPAGDGPVLHKIEMIIVDPPDRSGEGVQASPDAGSV